MSVASIVSPAEAPTLSSFTLAGRVIIVTGGGSGLGAVMARAIVASGGSLAIADINPTAGSAVASGIKDEFPTAVVSVHSVDVASEESVRQCVASVVDRHGKVDGLVTSAGFVENFPAEEYPVERMRKLWGVNVDGTYIFATEVARWMMQAGIKGSMVFIGSMSGSIVNVPQPQTPYNASKAAVRHMASSLAVEWAPKGIRVNCISPGYMRTALTEKILLAKPELKKPWVDLTPMQRMGNPVDLEGPVTFLLSDAARYVTGADLRVDGGYSIV
ncbi:hypothetical protein BROUX41_002775 [Berkeleyomyces rouxiae]|uniref:uncharacterized protein n=1 Tax=Berkeleyomyces rouxiae TaxID=2035830 RepID=UPI003B78DB78